MFTRFFLMLLACTCIFLIGCTKTPPVDTRADADALRAIEAQWTVAANARDIDKLLSFTAPDYVVMDANTPVSVGHQAYRKSLESWLADTLVSRTYSQTVDAVEVAASGDLAYTRGTSRYSQSTPNGLVDCSDKWVTIYKKINGKWKLAVGLGNSDKPLPAL